jgi:hypothetical protein
LPKAAFVILSVAKNLASLAIRPRFSAALGIADCGPCVPWEKRISAVCHLAAKAAQSYTDNGEMRSGNMTKKEIQAILDQFPDQVDTEQLMTELYLKAKLDRAETAVAKDDVVSHAEVIERSREWFR